MAGEMAHGSSHRPLELFETVLYVQFEETTQSKTQSGQVRRERGRGVSTRRGDPSSEALLQPLEGYNRYVRGRSVLLEPDFASMLSLVLLHCVPGVFQHADITTLAHQFELSHYHRQKRRLR